MEEREAGFYKQAAFPVTQPRVSKHLKESQRTDPNRENIINENTENTNLAHTIQGKKVIYKVCYKIVKNSFIK